MGFPRIAFVWVGFLASAGFSTAGHAAAVPPSDDPFATLTHTLGRDGVPGTLTAPAAEKFGLEPREYPERFVEAGKIEGTLRSVELVSDHSGTHIFFSQRTPAETITVRSGPEGEFILGLQRQNDSADVQELSGNQGRAFVDAEITYWSAWLAARKEN